MAKKTNIERSPLTSFQLLERVIVSSFDQLLDLASLLKNGKPLLLSFEMVEVERLNGINNRQGTNRENKMFKELLIANYPIKELFNNGK